MTMTRNSKQLSSKKIPTSQDSAPMANRRLKGDPIFLPDTHDEDTDTETDRSASESERELSDSDGDETYQTNDEIVDTLKHLKSQVAEHSKSIRDGITTMHKAMTQQRDFLQEQHDIMVEELKSRCDKATPKRSKMNRFLRTTSTLVFGAVLGVSALVAGAYFTIQNEQIE